MVIFTNPPQTGYISPIILWNKFGIRLLQIIFSVCVTDSQYKSEGGRDKTFFILFPEFANSKIFFYFSESVMQTENIFFTLQSLLKSQNMQKNWGAANLAKKSYGAPEGKHFLFFKKIKIKKVWGQHFCQKKVWGRRYANGEYFFKQPNLF